MDTYLLTLQTTSNAYVTFAIRYPNRLVNCIPRLFGAFHYIIITGVGRIYRALEIVTVVMIKQQQQQQGLFEL